MKRRLIFLFLVGSLVLLGGCAFLDSEVGWITISESKGYSLQAKGSRYRIHYYENDSIRLDWYLNDYQPKLWLKWRLLERPTAPGAYTKEEISGQGSAHFTMICKTWDNPVNDRDILIKRTYYKVDIILNKKMEVDTDKSSMTYWKTEEEEIKDGQPIE